MDGKKRQNGVVNRMPSALITVYITWQEERSEKKNGIRKTQESHASLPLCWWARHDAIDGGRLSNTTRPNKNHHSVKLVRAPMVQSGLHLHQRVQTDRQKSSLNSGLSIPCDRTGWFY